MKFICSLLLSILLLFSELIKAQGQVIDEVVWLIGDEAIFRSDVENIRLQIQAEGQGMEGDPYCIIPEQLAIQKLYLHQARLDSIKVSESQIVQMTDAWIQYIIDQIGSKEQVEGYFGKSISTLREERKQALREQSMIQSMQHKLVDGIKVTPAEVQNFYNRIPADSLPVIPTIVEVEIITLEPKIAVEEVEETKRKLREFIKLVTLGKREFSTLARLYSEDKESAKRGGELGFVRMGNLSPEFSAVAFELNDKQKVSRIVETEYGFHIIQLIEKKGDHINVRHILLKPHCTKEELEDASRCLDSIRADILNEKFTFEEAATAFSQDKETRNNQGLMINHSNRVETKRDRTSRFELEELPFEIRQVLSGMKAGDISNPFTWINSKQREVSVLVKLKSRVEEHKMTFSDDYQTVKEILEREKQDRILRDWLFKKQQETYIRIHEDWKNCDFQIKGRIIK